MTGDERYGYLPVGKSTALPEPCQEFGQGSLGTRLGCHRGTETQRWKEGSQRRFFSPSPLLSISLSFHLCVSVAELRIVVFGGSFAELDRLLAAFAGAGFARGDIANVAKIIEVVQFAIAPGLKFDDFDEVCGGEDSGGDLEVALAEAFVHPDGGGGVDRQERIEFAFRRLQSVDVSARFAVGSDLIEFFQFFSETYYLAAQRHSLRFAGRFCPVLSRRREWEHAGRQQR